MSLKRSIKEVIEILQNDYSGRAMELKEVASGFRFQVRQDYADYVAKLWEERPAKYSRALLETLVLIAYRQPITRGEIEAIRGVSVSSHIIKTLTEREWVRVIGHRDVPGKPAIYGSTKEFLDYFNLKSLDELPSLAEIKDFDKIVPELALEEAIEASSSEPASGAETTEQTDESEKLADSDEPQSETESVSEDETEHSETEIAKNDQNSSDDSTTSPENEPDEAELS
ncbi:MAG: SMC-Scp complex subunit ScpB [Gammaproteobacteria bacterium]|nr:SMC-Scp complex subunit ScpB [Gammaproteobacteria bacterium]